MALLEHHQMFNPVGRVKTRKLFLQLSETAEARELAPLCLNIVPKDNGKINLRSVFLEFVPDDLTEVTFAEHVFGDVRVWNEILKSGLIDKKVEEWREVADIKRKSRAFRNLVKEVTDNGKNAYGAAKYLIEEGWKPSRTKKDKEAKANTSDKAKQEVFEDDAIRLKDFTNVVALQQKETKEG